MKRVFIDTSYLIARSVVEDSWHAAACEAFASLTKTRLYSSDEVLSEYLNYFSQRGTHFRTTAVQAVELLLKDSSIRILPQTHGSFIGGLALYKGRKDKGYSLTDCITMNHMLTEGIHSILSSDDHFRQAGFEVLM